MARALSRGQDGAVAVLGRRPGSRLASAAAASPAATAGEGSADAFHGADRLERTDRIYRGRAKACHPRAGTVRPEPAPDAGQRQDAADHRIALSGPSPGPGDP